VKTCSYCGRENQDDAVSCRECGGTSFRTAPETHLDNDDSESGSANAAGDKIDFEPFKPEDSDKAWVTLMRCPTLPEADAVAMRLRAENIPVFLPDEYMMQALSINVSAYGFVRVQVPPSEYQNAREILET
jgi:hypothetical protein